MMARLLVAVLIVGFVAPFPARAASSPEPARINVWSTPPTAPPDPDEQVFVPVPEPTPDEADEGDDTTALLLCACGGVGSLVLMVVYVVLVGVLGR